MRAASVLRAIGGDGSKRKMTLRWPPIAAGATHLQPGRPLMCPDFECMNQACSMYTRSYRARPLRRRQNIFGTTNSARPLLQRPWLQVAAPSGSNSRLTAIAPTSAAMARTRAQTQREGDVGFFGRHGNVYMYIPNLIGASQSQPLQAAAGPHCRRHNDPPTLSSLSAPSLLRCTGYARVAAAVFAFGVAQRDPAACCAAYFASFVCDELDGRFARKFNQCSTLGSGEAGQGRILSASLGACA